MRLGVKASPRDVEAMLELPGATFVETVLWGHDLADVNATADAYSIAPEVVVHVPFTVPGGREVDVASRDAAHRETSLGVWHDTMRLADRLDARWVILHPGAIVPRSDAEGPDAGALRADALEHIEAALRTVSDEHGHARTLMENMPSHHHRADKTTDRCLTGIAPIDLLSWRDHTAGICLDVSHAHLTPGRARNLDTFLRRTAHDIHHMHLSDARAPDHEGLAIGNGDIDWNRLRDGVREIETHHPLTAVPEIKDGHLENGAGFRLALDFLATDFT